MTGHCWRMTSHEPRPAGTRTAKGAFATSNPTAAAGSNASRRRWLEATAPIDRGWNTLLNLRSWAMVGSGLVAVWSVRHPRFLLRWTKRSLGIWSTAYGPQAVAADRIALRLISHVWVMSAGSGASRRPASISSYCPIRFALLLAALITLPLRRYITLSIHFVYQ